MSREVVKGTTWTVEVARTLTEAGFVARRLPMGGRNDDGDVELEGFTGIIECKNDRAYQWSVWIDQAQAAADRTSGKPLSVVWAHRKGKGDPLDGYVVMSGRSFVGLMMQLIEVEDRG